jgi:hypothetical protein
MSVLRPQQILILGMALLVFISPISSFAQIDVVQQAIPKIKETPLLPPETFNAQTVEQSYKAPFGDETLGYSIRLPKNWSANLALQTAGDGQSNGGLSSAVFSMIARYVGQPVNLQRSEIVIEAIKLDRGIDLKSWLKNHILTGGQTITAMNEPSPSEIEVLYVKVDRDLTYIVRSRAFLNGPNIIMVNYYLPQENYELEGALQAQVLRAFSLLKPVDDSIEKQEVYGFLDQSFFNYPASWILKPQEIYSIDRMMASLYQQITPLDEREEPIITGQIQVFVISKLLKTSLADEVKSYKDGLKIPNYKLGGFIENISYTFKDGISGQTQAYVLEPEQASKYKPYEIVVSVLQGKDFYYILHLITPSRQHDFLTWSKNMTTFKVVNETLRRNKFTDDMEIDDPYYQYLRQEPSE